MKKFIVLSFVIALAMQAMGANVDLATARSSAQSFAASKMSNDKFMTPSAIDMKLVLQEMNSDDVTATAYYIFNTDEHFYIIAGDDRAPVVLAYGDRPLDVKRIPAGMQHWLDNCKGQVEYLQAHPGLVLSQKLNAPARAASVAPLLTAEWDQQEPYYNHCPVYNGELCVTGCPATSLAMVFYYWKYPVGPTPTVNGYNNYTGGFRVEDLPSITFDWANMLDKYTAGNYNEAQADAVAWLMRYIGQEEEMDYTPSGSGAYGSDVLRAAKFFGYNQETAAIYYQYSYSNSQWAAMIQEELVNNRPIVYCAYDSYAGGHAFNVDGYDATDDTYHINWGWSGDGNCYCVLNNFTDGYYSFTDDQQMVIGIQPPYLGPTIEPSALNVSIESYAEKSATEVLTVYGYYLEHDVTVTLNDPNGVFSIDADHVALSDVEAGKDITITYAPQEVGTHNATITLTCEGAEDVVVNIVGTSVFETHVPVMLEANEDYITLTEFRADWTDETPAKNVESYTLEVATKPITALLGEADFSDCVYSSSSVISHWQDYFPDGWTYEGNQLFTGSGCIQLGSRGAIITPQYDLTGYDKVTVKMRAKRFSTWSTSGVTIATSQQSVHIDLAEQYTDYVFVLDCADSEQVTITGDGYPNNYGQIENIQVYAGDASEPQLNAVSEEGDATYRLVSGITPDKFYTVKNLTPGGTFFFRVKAHYTDDSWSVWSKAKTVVLKGEGHGYQPGDVDHDGEVVITDVTTLIDHMLGGSEVCPICADVNGDGTVDIADVTALIDLLLGN